uniref:protein-synthesizing GTPase n=1 Tax=Strombidium inclinatum TaxID=197538 RepID=A0A7S3MV25_9SPIT|mmetsp:Transcript_16774/g.25846  ORF Transcript_16774/g.25846 Transcript_16774/m.25846 type:complete len:400 (+) Transcript_16774:303-1502(+)
MRNITIKLGYANAKLYKCTQCPPPKCFQPYGSGKEDKAECKYCCSQLFLLRHVSFVDCPGHDVLMATMLAGAAVMDSALLLVAANQPCPMPQTREHLAAVEIMDLDQIIILQNKIDIIIKDPNACIKQKEDIKNFIEGTVAEGAPIIPISAQLCYNIDTVVDYVTRIPIPVRDFISPPQLIIIRSFDVNKPGEDAETLKGGVAGGTILKGVLRVGDKVSIKPGLITKSQRTGAVQCREIQSQITSLMADENRLMYAVPGGLIGVGLKVDPLITRQDQLVGQIIGHPESMPDVLSEIDAQFYLLKRLLGVKTTSRQTDAEKRNKVSPLKTDELLLINVGSTSLAGKIISVKKDTVKIEFSKPVCANIGEKIALSRRIDNNFRLIGWGEIKRTHSSKNYNN